MQNNVMKSAKVFCVEVIRRRTALSQDEQDQDPEKELVWQQTWEGSNMER